MITPNKEYYRNLVTSEYRLAPKFNEMVRQLVDYNCELDRSILSLVEKFDIDTATDDQLDILGACVGVHRTLNFEPSPAAEGRIVCPTAEEMAKDTGKESIYMVYKTPKPSLMDTADMVEELTAKEMTGERNYLNDDVFRIMVKARIIQNIWKGNVLQLYEMWKNLFSDSQGIQIQDLQDMSFNIVLIGNYPALMRELIMHGYIIPKPEGVRINILSFVNMEGLPIFAYDYNTLQYSGYTAHWIQVSNTK